MNIAVMAGLYLGGVWVWQNVIPTGIRSHLATASQQAVSTVSAEIAH